MRGCQSRQRAKGADGERTGHRVVLRPLSDEDLCVVASWYEKGRDLPRRLEEAKVEPTACLLAVSRGCEVWAWTRRRCDWWRTMRWGAAWRAASGLASTLTTG
jgi:hypothetical protein